MIALRSFPTGDLLAEIDVMSSVSGGTLLAALHAVTRDTSLRIDDVVALTLQSTLREVDAPKRQALNPS